MKPNTLMVISLMVGLLLSGTFTAANACTGIKVQTNDGAVVTGRTLEFGLTAPYAVTIVPRGTEVTAAGPGGKPGKSWKSSFATVGVSGWGQPTWYIEGLNEKGLAAGVFYLPGFAQYQTAKPGEEGRAISQNEFIYYLLSTCATVKDVEQAINNVLLVAVDSDPRIVTNPIMRGAMPFHLRVTDAGGRSVVIEYTAQGVQVFENPLGVITNAPTFDWHLLNMRNYISLSTTDAPPMEFNGQTISQFGLGSGLRGLPGDFTPPSRYIRAAILNKNLVPGKTAAEGVSQAWHLLHLFDIPSGVSGAAANGVMIYDTTQLTTVSDHRNVRFYFNSYDDSRVRMVDLKRVDLNAASPVTVPFGARFDYLDVTPSGK